MGVIWINHRVAWKLVKQIWGDGYYIWAHPGQKYVRIEGERDREWEKRANPRHTQAKLFEQILIPLESFWAPSNLRSNTKDVFFRVICPCYSFISFPFDPLKMMQHYFLFYNIFLAILQFQFNVFSKECIINVLGMRWACQKHFTIHIYFGGFLASL